MTSLCRCCKREIARGQQVCHICSAPQGFVRYHFKTGIILLLVVGGLASFGHWYIDKAVNQVNDDMAQLANLKTAETQQTMLQLELQLEQSLQKLQQAETRSGKTGDLTEQLQTQLKAAELKSIEAEKRADWLSKANKKLTTEVDDLTLQISAAQQKALANSTQGINILTPPASETADEPSNGTQ